MTERQTDPEKVRIEVEAGTTGLFYATSPDVPGLFVGARTPEGARHAARQALHALADLTEVPK